MKENWIEMQEMKKLEKVEKLEGEKRKDKKREDSLRKNGGGSREKTTRRREQGKKRRKEIENDRKKHGVDREERKNVLVKNREERGEKDCKEYNEKVRVERIKCIKAKEEKKECL